MRRIGHTEFRPNIAKTVDAVEVMSHDEPMGYWLPVGSPEYLAMQKALPKGPSKVRVTPLQPRISGKSPHDHKRPLTRDEILRRISRG